MSVVESTSVRSMNPINPLPSGVFSKFITVLAEDVRFSCTGCGLPLESRPAVKIPGVAGMFCSGECVETSLFGIDRCRWCGTSMEKPYTSVDSRLCSDDCSQMYYAHVLGDRTAELGSGKRFVAWLRIKRRALYEQLIGAHTEESHRVGRPRKPVEVKRASAAARQRRYREKHGQQPAPIAA